MKEELEKRLLESMDKITIWIEEAESFAREQAPLVVQELLDYRFAEHLAKLIFVLLLIVTLIGFARFSYKKAVDWNWENAGEGWAFSVGISIIASFLFSAIALFEVIPLLKIWYAPRVYVLEQLRHLF